MYDLPIRQLTVVSVHRPTPRTARVTFALPAGEFALAGPDQQVKLYFPRPGQDRPELPEPAPGQGLMDWYAACQAVPEQHRPWMRSFTLRAHDAELHTVDVDFVLHGPTGPAARWAARAEPGQVLAMFGPSPEFARPFPLDGDGPLLFACDESALPALGTLVEALPAGTRAHAWIEVAGPEEHQPLLGFGELTATWVHRGDAPPGQRLLAAVRAAALPADPAAAWLAGEAGAVRALRRHLLTDRRLPRSAVHFTGYWRRRLTQDDAPTPADLADAREILGRNS
ncbi:siderophore-interacting protein [Streptomyces sp. TLI_171]|uniref:siderophore-interacting protein n=1 Tax=Streptomyces sp. TLI_171 TaxID=1938859 RepID=UPI000C17F009|nr:siderophore-interacting protein [Streptomyces sp. TLI_171]RKE18802.1 NADPH-dependent ferric siderophore reductase [Streptomyces sp. TLI_171]